MGKKTLKSSKAANIFWRIFISAVGAALIFIGIINLLLFFFGTAASAVVTTRRVGGADDGRVSNQRYQWSIHYTFTDADGANRDGYATRRGSDTSVKIETKVYYFPFAPYIHALESDAAPGLSQPLYICLGVLLIVVMNRKKKPAKRKPIKDSSELTDYDDSVEEQYHHDS